MPQREHRRNDRRDIFLLQASIANRGGRRFYTITPEALKELYKRHHRDPLRRGMRNLALFEAYVEYCFAPKHTVGEQLLDVRRDKKERTDFAAAEHSDAENEEEEESDDIDSDLDERYRVEIAEQNGAGGGPGEYNA